MKSILITGAYGQLGSACSDVLGHRFNIIKTGARPINNKSKLDVSSKESVKNFLDQHTPDIILNLAAMTDVRESITDPVKAFEINLQATIALCNASGPILGVVTDPLSDRIFAGTQSRTPFTVSLTNLSEHRPITPRPATRPYRLVTSWNEALSKEDLLPASLDAGAFLMEAVSGALKFCLLATGEADVHARSASYMEWDCAAGDGILRSMGIAVRDRETNQPLTYNSMSLRVGNLYASRL